MKGKYSVLSAFVLGCGSLLTPVASASPINISGGGGFAIGNFSVNVQGTPASGCINFYNTTLNGCNVSPATLSVNAPVDANLFAVGETGTIKDIQNSNAVSSFIVLNGAASSKPDITFDLLNVVIPNNQPACTSSTSSGACSIPGTPFVFTLLDTTSISVTFKANLCGYMTGSTPGAGCSTGTLYSALYTSQFEGQTLQQLVNAEQGAGGISNSISGTLTAAPATVVPEPGTIVLLGLGFAGIGIGVRRKRNA